MRKTWLGMMGVAALLAACGGGGGGAGSTTGGSVQLPAGPKTYVAAKTTVGDYYIFKTTDQDLEPFPSQPTDTYSVRQIISASADGAHTVRYVRSVPIKNGTDYRTKSSTRDLDGLGHWLKNSYQSGSEECVDTPTPVQYNIAPYTISVGTNWKYVGANTTKCSLSTNAQTTQIEADDSAVAEEEITVTAGTFKTIKVTDNETQKYADVVDQFERTCWWEPELGIEVKCTIKWTSTAPGMPKTVALQTRELYAYSNQKTGRKLDSKLRFLGAWNGSFDGTASGTCKLLIRGGQVDGECIGAPAPLKVTGQVSDDGQLSLSMTYNGLAGQFTGKVDSLQQMSGTWSVPNYGSGTWVVKQ